MTPRDLPLVGRLFADGRDAGFDALLLLGPALVLALFLLDHSPVTVALAAGYVLAFCAHVLRNALR